MDQINPDLSKFLQRMRERKKKIILLLNYADYSRFTEIQIHNVHNYFHIPFDLLKYIYIIQMTYFSDFINQNFFILFL